MDLDNEFIKLCDLHTMYHSERGFKRRKIEIPSFQRFKCWNDNMRKCLISSIYKRFPIGTITTYLDKIEKNTEKLIIIDGLQRINTIISYLEDPFNNNYNKEILLKQIEDTYKSLDINPIIIREIFLSYFSKQNFSILNKVTKNRNNDPIKVSLAKLPQTINSKKFSDLYDIIADLTNEFNEKFKKLCDYQVHVTVCYCDEDVLPEIFENLNVNSKKLEPNEIFAATWQKKSSITIENSKIVKNIGSYYKQFEVIYGAKIRFDEKKMISIQNKSFNCYEYLMGFGQLMVDHISDAGLKKYFYTTVDKHKLIKKQLIFDIITILISDKCLASEVPIKLNSLNEHELNEFECLVLESISFTVKVMKWALFAYDRIIFNNMSLHSFAIILLVFFKNHINVKKNEDYYIELFVLHMFFDRMMLNFVNITIQNIAVIPKKCDEYMNKISELDMKNAILKINKKSNKMIAFYFFFLLNKFQMIEYDYYNTVELNVKKREEISMWKKIVSSKFITKINNSELKQCENNIGNIYFSPCVINCSQEMNDENNMNDYEAFVINEEIRQELLIKLNEYLNITNIDGLLNIINARSKGLIDIFINKYKHFLND